MTDQDKIRRDLWSVRGYDMQGRRQIVIANYDLAVLFFYSYLIHFQTNTCTYSASGYYNIGKDG